MGTLKFFLIIQILLVVLVLVAIIYLAWRKVKKSRDEKFEKRDN